MIFLKMIQVFLDCDGVLADFDTAAIHLLGQHPRKVEEVIGTHAFWRRLEEVAFFFDLPLMNDARKLYEDVAHLKPIILTGCPPGGWAEPQKRAWVARHFPSVDVITCMSKDKSRHLNPGDVLIDDYLAYKHLWEDAGGIFVHHKSAESSLAALRGLGVMTADQLCKSF
jgi:hypothetical protein